MDLKTKFGILLMACLVLSGCVPMDDGSYSNGGYRDPYGNYDNRNDDRYDNRYDWERERLRREREELERERRRLEEERRREDDHRRPYGKPRLPAPLRFDDGCPPGFRPGDHKCTSSERKRGCKDTHGSNGGTCVSGNY